MAKRRSGQGKRVGRDVVSVVAVFLLVSALLVQAQSFGTPPGPAPDNGALNSISLGSDFIVLSSPTDQIISSSIVVASSTQSSAILGDFANNASISGFAGITIPPITPPPLASLNIGGAAIYGYALNNSGLGVGAHGVAQGSGAAGVVGRISNPLVKDIGGRLDAGFGASGTLVSSLGATDHMHDMVIAGNYVYIGGAEGWIFEKRNLVDGSLDTAFGASGVINEAIGADPHGMAADAQYFYAAGHDGSGRWRIEKRRLVDGGFDSGFGTGGQITLTSANLAYDIAIDANFMYVAGNAGIDWYIEKRRLDTGALCNAVNCPTAFDGDGIVTVAGRGGAKNLAIDGTSMYVVGSDTAVGNKWRIEKRRLDTGALVTGSIGPLSDGVIVDTETFTDNESAQAIRIDGTHMYVAGGQSTGGFVYPRIEKRLLTTGEKDLNFADDGNSHVSRGYMTYTLALDGAHLYLMAIRQGTGASICSISRTSCATGADCPAGEACASNDNTFIIQKRSTATGAFDLNFGARGIIMETELATDGQVILVDGSFLYAGTKDAAANWQVQKRYKDATSDTLAGKFLGPVKINTFGVTPGTLTVQGSLMTPRLTAISNNAAVPAVQSNNGITATGRFNNAINGQADNAADFGVYGESTNSAGIYSVNSLTGVGLGSMTGARGNTFAPTNGAGSYGESELGNGVSGITGSASNLFAVEGEATGNFGASNYNASVYGRGGAYAGIFEGDLKVNSGYTLFINRSGLTETALCKMIKWCKSGTSYCPDGYFTGADPCP